MQCSITYVNHNSFVLSQGKRAFLFDYPEEAHLPAGAADAARQAVSGTDLTVLISHGHVDHLHGDLASVTSAAAVVRYVISDDVEELRPEAVPDNGEVLTVEPDERYEFHGLAIETLMSNDLGVAFLVREGDFRFYYGGDLANWTWPGASEREAAFTEQFFTESLERVRTFGPHVAFANLDQRLPNLAGGPEACRIINAPVFVPMHGFGDETWVKSMKDRLAPCASEVFTYARPGDTRVFVF